MAKTCCRGPVADLGGGGGTAGPCPPPPLLTHFSKNAPPLFLPFETLKKKKKSIWFRPPIPPVATCATLDVDSAPKKRSYQWVIAYVFFFHMINWSFILGKGWLLSNNFCTVFQNCLHPSFVTVHKAVRMLQ